jgi:hypothetical protein
MATYVLKKEQEFTEIKKCAGRDDIGWTLVMWKKETALQRNKVYYKHSDYACPLSVEFNIQIAQEISGLGILLRTFSQVVYSFITVSQH